MDVDAVVSESNDETCREVRTQGRRWKRWQASRLSSKRLLFSAAMAGVRRVRRVEGPRRKKTGEGDSSKREERQVGKPLTPQQHIRASRLCVLRRRRSKTERPRADSQGRRAKRKSQGRASLQTSEDVACMDGVCSWPLQCVLPMKREDGKAKSVRHADQGKENEKRERERERELEPKRRHQGGRGGRPGRHPQQANHAKRFLSAPLGGAWWAQRGAKQGAGPGSDKEARARGRKAETRASPRAAVFSASSSPPYSNPALAVEQERDVVHIEPAARGARWTKTAREKAGKRLKETATLTALPLPSPFP